jgi:hypothetical protein
MGNPKRIGPVAKRYTLDAQVEREPEVAALLATLSATEAAFEKVLGRMRTAASSQADVADAMMPEFFSEWLHNESEWNSTVRNTSAQLNNTLSNLRSELQDHFRTLTATRISLAVATTEAENRIVAAARVLLCTVASVGGAFRRGALAPLLKKTKLAVLDEAGTTPESKLPLLLLLPALKSIVAIGDQDQLEPFTRCQSSNRGRRGKPRGEDMCRSFVENGRCSRQPCRFSHNMDAHLRAQRENGPCSSLSELSGCRFGGTCKYSHDLTTSAPAITGYLQRLAQIAAIRIPTLTEQYRMHPKLCEMVSRLFYHGQLVTPEDVASKRRQQDAHGMYHIPVLDGLESQPQGRSYANEREARHVLKLYESHEPRPNDDRSFLVITFYKAQAKLLRSLFRDAGHEESDAPGRGLQIVTVDKSQGSEADVVIISCVRSNSKSALGFLTNPNRANVAISRARSRLLIVGNTLTLAGRPGLWKDVLGNCTIARAAAALPPLQLNKEAPSDELYEDVFPSL